MCGKEKGRGEVIFQTTWRADSRLFAWVDGRMASSVRGSSQCAGGRVGELLGVGRITGCQREPFREETGFKDAAVPLFVPFV